MPHQLWIRVLIAHHGGAHLLQGKPQRLWLAAGGRSRLSFLPCLLALSQVGQDKEGPLRAEHKLEKGGAC